jgi:hypothetical protein
MMLSRPGAGAGRAPALSPTVSVRGQLFDHIHATMVSTRAGAGSSTVDAVGWLALWFEERVRRNGQDIFA